jgi:hypothetical protein
VIGDLQHEIGNPPDRVAAKALAKRLDLQITIISPDGSWSTDGEPAVPSGMTFHRYRLADGREIETAHDERRFMVRLTEHGYTLLLSPHDFTH